VKILGEGQKGCQEFSFNPHVIKRYRSRANIFEKGDPGLKSLRTVVTEFAEVATSGFCILPVSFLVVAFGYSCSVPSAATFEANPFSRDLIPRLNLFQQINL